MAVVVIDTGIDLDHAFFGGDANHDGIADRIVFQYDFAGNDADASDRAGHGSHITSLIGAADGSYGGVAPGADLIALKVFDDAGKGYFSYLENALRWVINNADTFNVGVVNLSLGDGGNWSSAIARFGLGDELAALAARNIIVTAATGNNFARFGGAWGVAYPAADPAVLAVGATWATNAGGPWAFSGGSTDYSTGADRIASFSQRDDELLDVFAPGTRLVGANATGGITTMQGTSQASAVMAGVATLAQDLALQTLGRRLSLTEFQALLDSTSVHIVDGDDENDNVRNSQLGFGRVDVHALAEAILALPVASPGGGGGGGGGGGSNGGAQPAAGSAVHSVTLRAGDAVTGLDFGNFLQATLGGTVFHDLNADGLPGAGEAGLAGMRVFVDANGNGSLDAGEASTVSDGAGHYLFSNIGPGSHTVVLAAQDGFTLTANRATVSARSGATLDTALGANALPQLSLADIDINEGAVLTLTVAGSDAGDVLHYSLVGDLPAGATLDADTGALRWAAADGDSTHTFTVRATDSAGGSVIRSFAARVHDVAPTLQVSGAATAEEGADYLLRLSATDPGTDTLATWRIDWGDGIVQTVAGNTDTLVHRYASAGRFAITATATDEDGSYGASGPTVDVSPAVLQVQSVQTTASGFAVRFNRAIDTSTLNLYGAADASLGAADIVLTDSTGKAVAGSVVVDADGRGLRFVRTGGLLAAGSYSLRLASGALALHDAAGHALDGNGDGVGGDAYLGSLSVAPSNSAVLAIGEIARGPGQPVNIPADGLGLPVSLANAAGATQVAFTLRYDSRLLAITGAANGSGLPSGSTLQVDLSVAGQVRVQVTSSAPLGAGTLELVRLMATVPFGALYGAAQVLDLTDVLVNGGAIPVRDDDGLHVVAYIGDATGDKAYTTLDVTRMQRVITRSDSGFSAFPTVDPVVIGDVNLSGSLTSADAARLLQQINGAVRPEIPVIPVMPVLPAWAGGGFAINLGGNLGSTGGGSGAGGSTNTSTDTSTTTGPAWITTFLGKTSTSVVIKLASKPGIPVQLVQLAPKLL